MIRTFVKSLFHYSKLKGTSYELKMNRFEYAMMIEQWNKKKQKGGNKDVQKTFPEWRCLYQQEPIQNKRDDL